MPSAGGMGWCTVSVSETEDTEQDQSCLLFQPYPPGLSGDHSWPLSRPHPAQDECSTGLSGHRLSALYAPRCLGLRKSDAHPRTMAFKGFAVWERAVNQEGHKVLRELCELPTWSCHCRRSRQDSFQQCLTWAWNSATLIPWLGPRQELRLLEEPYLEFGDFDFPPWAEAAGRGVGPSCILSSWQPLVWPSGDPEFSIGTLIPDSKSGRCQVWP